MTGVTLVDMVYGSIGQENQEISTGRFSLRLLAVLVLTIATASLIYLGRHVINSSVDSGLLSSDSTFSFPQSFWSYSDFSPSPAEHVDLNGPVYPYSVIPGGVSSAQNLQAALHRDAVAAAHYAGFHVESARLIRLGSERRAHVSYRIGDKIYWTRKEVTLHAGETVLTDGVHLARTRCGNRIADVSAGPSSPAEPPVEVMDRPTFPHPPEFTKDGLPGSPVWPDGAAPFLLAYAPSPRTSAGTYPYLPIIPCCVMGPAPKPSTGPPPTPPAPPIGPIGPTPPGGLPQPAPPPVVTAPTPPVVATPEPSTLLCVIAGLAAIAFLKLRRA